MIPSLWPDNRSSKSQGAHLELASDPQAPDDQETPSPPSRVTVCLLAQTTVHSGTIKTREPVSFVSQL